MGTLYISSSYDNFYDYVSGFYVPSLIQDGNQIATDLAGSLSLKKLATDQVAVATANDILVIDGSGITLPLNAVLSGSGSSLTLNNVGGSLSEIQLWQGGSFQGSTVTGGTELFDAALSSTQYSLSYGGNQLIVTGSGLPTDAAAVAALLAGTYSGGNLDISSLTLSSAGKTIMLALSPTAYTLTAGDYQAVFTGTGLPTALTPAYLEQLLQGYTTATLGGSVTGITVTQISTGATVLTESGIGPISLDQIALDPRSLTAYGLSSASTVQLSAADAVDMLDSLDATARAGILKSIQLTDSGTPTLTLTGAEAYDSAALALISTPHKLVANGITAAAAGDLTHKDLVSYSIVDSADDLSYSLDFGRLGSDAQSGLLTGVTLSDSGIASLSLSADDVSADAALLALIKSPFIVMIQAPYYGGGTVTGVPGHGSTVSIAGWAKDTTLVAAGDGTSFTATNSDGVYHISGVNAVKFDDYTDIVAQALVTDKVTTGNLTELYAAVLAREPDVAGLAYYQAELAANPAIPLISFAQSFLASPEYTGNPAHNYAQSAAGDAQFITDTYHNLLHRAPEAGAVAWYQANVIAPFLATVTPGTAAYTNAETLAHAQLLVDFSASAEFLADVQVTAANPTSSQHWLFLV